MQLNYSSWRSPAHARAVAGFGSSYKQRVRELQPAMFQLGAWGKVEGRDVNRVMVHRETKDKWGIPIPVVEFKWSENDLKLFRDMRRNVAEIYDTLGTELLMPGSDVPAGFASHEVGSCRMGNDPKTSVLNGHNQAHEVKNLFVVDGSSFTTFSEKNPTLTIAALSVRAARFIAKSKKRGEL